MRVFQEPRLARGSLFLRSALSLRASKEPVRVMIAVARATLFEQPISTEK